MTPIPSTLQRYVLRELLTVALISVIALVSIIFVGMSASLVQHGLSIVQLADLIPFVVSMSLPYALPSALLLASVFVFGRLAAQNEIGAMRSSGVNLNYVIFPPLVLGLLISVGSFGLNHYLLPWSVKRVSQMKNQIIAYAIGKISSGGYQEYPLGDYRMFVGGKDPQTGLWTNVALIHFDGANLATQLLFAQRATCKVDERTAMARVTLYDGKVIQPRYSTGEEQPPVSFSVMTVEQSLKDASKTSLNRPGFMKYSQLVNEIAERRAEVDRLRQDPEYAHVWHPKGLRTAVEQANGKELRKLDVLRAALNEQGKKHAKARTAVEQAEGAHLTARAAYDAALQRRDELDKEHRDLRQALDHAQAEPHAPAEGAGRTEARQTERLKQVTALLAAANQKLDRASKVLATATQQLEEHRSTLVTEDASLAAMQQEASDLKARVDAGIRKVDNLKSIEKLYRAETEYHFRNAGALTCFVFMLIGIPLGIVSRHGNIITAFVISFGMVLIVYYPLTAVMQILSMDGYFSTGVLQWLPNTAVGLIGVALLISGVRR